VRTWAVEFDGPSHFLASKAPTGAILLKRRHLQLLGHALVSVPYWELGGCNGAGEREQYLSGKLEVSPLSRQSARDEERDKERDREREKERERERQKDRERERAAK
jgi:hypothetical protein